MDLGTLMKFGPWGVAAALFYLVAKLLLEKGFRIKIEAEVPPKR
jgi:hypothetical protein